MEVSDERVVELVIDNDVRRAKVELVYTRDLIWVINLALATEELYGHGRDVIDMLLGEMAKMEVRAILSLGGSMVATALKHQSAYMIDLLKKSMYNTSQLSGSHRRARSVIEHIDDFKAELTAALNNYVITPEPA